jgi:DNA-binding response OmpR family regulator
VVGLRTTQCIEDNPERETHMAIKTILIVEDDRFIGEMYVRSLKKANYNVDWMVDGNDGLIAARNKQYDLILLDVMLPERRGSDILEALRGGAEDLIPHSRVLILTNFEQDDESRMAMEKKSDGYLIKAEITPSKLLSVIAQLDQPA